LDPQTYKAHLAKFVLILADKNYVMGLKVTKAKYAAKVLGCPEVSGCYGSVCEEIEEAVSALGGDSDELIVSTKECTYCMSYRIYLMSSHKYIFCSSLLYLKRERKLRGETRTCRNLKGVP
jgi:hypothetical protein